MAAIGLVSQIGLVVQLARFLLSILACVISLLLQEVYCHGHLFLEKEQHPVNIKTVRTLFQRKQAISLQKVVARVVANIGLKQRELLLERFYLQIRDKPFVVQRILFLIIMQYQHQINVHGNRLVIFRQRLTHRRVRNLKICMEPTQRLVVINRLVKKGY